MNKSIFYIIICALVASCTKRDTVGAPEFEVIPNGTTFKVGDSIIFTFKGNPQNIVFWPGTPGFTYEYRNRTFTNGNKLLMRFNSYQQFVIRNNNLSVLVLNDFNGTFDKTNIQAATWTDITDRFVLSEGADQVESGTVDLSEFTADNKAATIAFRYVTEDFPSQTRWVIRSFNVDLQTEDGTITPLVNVGTAGWKAVSFENPNTNWTIMSTQVLTGAVGGVADEDWILTKSFNPNTVSPDKGIAIKNITTGLTRYAPALQTYTKPGTYKAVFEATNFNYQSPLQRVVKEVTITITP